MASLNKVLLIGNLTRDPELRYTPGGTAVVNLRMAINRRFKDRSGEMKQEACFMTVVAWDKQAEVCNQYLRKGSPLFVEGRLQTRNWDGNDGKKHSVVEVRAERIQFLGQAGQKQEAPAEEPQSAPPAGGERQEGPVLGPESDEVSWGQDMTEDMS
ncbi:MAG: single-stranded DNA-binding protein [Candidatus Omnitrophota bacterium]